MHANTPRPQYIKYIYIYMYTWIPVYIIYTQPPLLQPPLSPTALPRPTSASLVDFFPATTTKAAFPPSFPLHPLAPRRHPAPSLRAADGGQSSYHRPGRHRRSTFSSRSLRQCQPRTARLLTALPALVLGAAAAASSVFPPPSLHPPPPPPSHFLFSLSTRPAYLSISVWDCTIIVLFGPGSSAGVVLP